ncbi:MAG: decarboxylating NADP(+)-dependent phosphogluconate dehydrogenase [Spirochaetes bacterium]|nr:decarboxylating NADP(+)-dependent phosphogluconate dehydrogenase [Spirochaetota bacterium]
MPGSVIGIYGLGIMGRNLALNFAGRGHAVSVYNRDEPSERVHVGPFLESSRGKGITGAGRIEEFLSSIEPPRRIVLMIKAGPPVDEALERLVPFLFEGDIIIDCGNSDYLDTERRLAALGERGILYVGCGVSGGAEGALRGPSLMPGGAPGVWASIRPLFESVAARLGDGSPCCTWIGPGGSGHFVKMAHNGIEYSLMQVHAEAFDLMRRGLGMPDDEIAAVTGEWNRGRLGSYLAGMIADILATRDADGASLLEKIRDSVGQKGTGSRAASAALELASPSSVLAASVFARMVSSRGDLRARLSRDFPGTGDSLTRSDSLLRDLEDAVYCSAAVSCDQGFSLMRAAAAEYGWHLDFADVARTWRGGCIIRSAMMDNIEEVFRARPGTPTILTEGPFAGAIREGQGGWRRALGFAIDRGVPVPSMSSALACFDAMRSPRLPADLLQAMRDYFGAHGFERRDTSPGERHHGNWKRSSRGGFE